MPSDKMRELLSQPHEPTTPDTFPRTAETPQAPPAPPPMQPPPGPHNPYDFILNPAAPPKKTMIPAGNSKLQRIIVVAVLGIVLTFVVIIVLALLNSAGSATKQEWLKLVQQQNELIRVSEIGMQKAQGGATKNLAITTQLILESTQTEITALAKSAGADLNKETISAGEDPQTDSKLTSAEQTNQFDSVFSELLRSSLRTYKRQLDKLHDLSGTKTKASLASASSSIAVLVPEETSREPR